MPKDMKKFREKVTRYLIDRTTKGEIVTNLSPKAQKIQELCEYHRRNSSSTNAKFVAEIASEILGEKISYNGEGTKFPQYLMITLARDEAGSGAPLRTPLLVRNLDNYVRDAKKEYSYVRGVIGADIKIATREEICKFVGECTDEVLCRYFEFLDYSLEAVEELNVHEAASAVAESEGKEIL